jgi:hypothetical protein
VRDVRKYNWLQLIFDLFGIDLFRHIVSIVKPLDLVFRPERGKTPPATAGFLLSWRLVSHGWISRSLPAYHSVEEFLR